MRAQASAEMLMVLSAVLALFIFAFGIIGGQVETIAGLRDSLDAFRVASGLGSAINSVFLAGDGTTIIVNINADNASAQISGRYLNVRIRDAYYDWPLLTGNISATSVALGDIEIKKANGGVSIG